MTTIKDFHIISKLGEGAYSSVYKVKRLSDGQEYALKKVLLLDLSEKERQNALNEVRILASIRHQNMIAYKEAFLEESSNSLCIVMEYANNGDLFQKITEHQKKGTNFPEPEIWNIFIQMTKALKALHDMKIFHRDLKSANVFLNKDGTVKLGDLNVSKVAKKGLLYTQTGTPYYASPEVWRDMPYDHKSDVWSLGCVVYEITTLKPPFRAEDMEGLYKKVLRGYYPKIPTHYSQDLSNIIRALLQVSPHLRPSCDKMLQLPAIVKRMDDKHLNEVDDEERNDLLLNTIRVPKNLHFLTERLPKANYTPLRTKKMDKHRFLQTLAGYKDSSLGHNIMEEAVRGSESVDSYKNKEHGRVYLPPVGKDVQSKNIKDIYLNSNARDTAADRTPPGARHSAIQSDKSYENVQAQIITAKRNAEARKRAKQLQGDDDKVTERGRSLKEEKTKYTNSSVAAVKAAYKVHNMNQDAEFKTNINNIKNIYGVKESGRPAIDLVSGKDPIHVMIKRHKNQMMNHSPSQEGLDYDVKRKDSKLPNIGQKQSKLPPLNGEEKTLENTQSPKKNKIKEMSKAYKVNVGNLDEIQDRYSVGAKGGRANKGSVARNYPNGLEYGINGVKYGKGYTDF